MVATACPSWRSSAAAWKVRRCCALAGSRAGRSIPLGAREFNLLEFLARHAGQVVTRTMMLEKIWNYHFDPGSNVVDVHIGRLRRKLEEGFPTPILHTVRGAGYRLAVEG